MLQLMQADLGLGPLRGRGDRRPLAAPDAAAATPDADDLPGPLRLAEPAQAGRPDRRRAAAAAEGRLRRRAAPPGPGAARAGRALARALQPLPARVLRRPAAADRDRPGARAEAEAGRRRRAGLRPRRLDPGADHQPARRPPGRVRPHLPLRRPRHRRRPPHLRPDRGNAPRQDRRAGRGGPGLRAAARRVHEEAAGGGADPGPAREPRPARAGRRGGGSPAAQPCRSLRRSSRSWR